MRTVLSSLGFHQHSWRDLRHLLPPLLTALRHRRSEAAPDDISSVLTSLAQLGAPWEGEGAVRGFATSLLVTLRSKQRSNGGGGGAAAAQAPRSALAESLWALAVLGARVGPDVEDEQSLVDALKEVAAGASSDGVGFGRGCCDLSMRHMSWVIWAAGEVGAQLGSQQLASLLASMRQQAASMTADDLTAVLVGCSKQAGSESDLDLKALIWVLVEAVEPGVFEGYPDHAVEAIYALARLGVLPHNFLNSLLTDLLDLGARGLSARQIQLVAAALAMLGGTEECSQAVGMLVREMCRRLPSSGGSSGRSSGGGGGCYGAGLGGGRGSKQVGVGLQVQGRGAVRGSLPGICS